MYRLHLYGLRTRHHTHKSWPRYDGSPAAPAPTCACEAARAHVVARGKGPLPLAREGGACEAHSASGQKLRGALPQAVVQYATVAWSGGCGGGLKRNRRRPTAHSRRGQQFWYAARSLQHGQTSSHDAYAVADGNYLNQYVCNRARGLIEKQRWQERRCIEYTD